MVERSCQTEQKIREKEASTSPKKKGNAAPCPVQQTKCASNKRSIGSCTAIRLKKSCSTLSTPEIVRNPMKDVMKLATIDRTEEEEMKKRVLARIENSQFLKMEFGKDSTESKEIPDGKIFTEWPYACCNWIQVRKEPKKKKAIEEMQLSRSKRETADSRTIKDIIYEVQKMRRMFDRGKATDRRVAEEQPLYLSENASLSCIPTFVEVEAKPIETISKSKLLTTDEMLKDFLKLRHAMNVKLLERLKDKGLTMNEVELSIYNSKHRKNSYGQGKLIESRKSSIDKAIGEIPTSK